MRSRTAEAALRRRWPRAALPHRYGRAGGHDVLAYRGFEIRISLGTHFVEAEILKATISRGMVHEATVDAPTRKEAIAKAKRMIDAMRGD